MRPLADGGSQAPEQGQADDFGADAPSGVHMACIFQAGKLGIAVYEATSAEVLHPPMFLQPLLLTGCHSQDHLSHHHVRFSSVCCL